jgi:hypothetical protein
VRAGHAPDAGTRRSGSRLLAASRGKGRGATGKDQGEDRGNRSTAPYRQPPTHHVNTGLYRQLASAHQPIGII